MRKFASLRNEEKSMYWKLNKLKYLKDISPADDKLFNEVVFHVDVNLSDEDIYKKSILLKIKSRDVCMEFNRTI